MQTTLIPSRTSRISLLSQRYVDRSVNEVIEIMVGPGIKCSYFFFPSDGIKNRSFYLSSGSSIDMRGIVFGTNIKSQLTFIIEGEDITAHMDILAFAKSNARVHIEGNAKVRMGSKKVDIRVDQTNILLGEEAYIRGMPVLEVATDDVVGGHSCKIHRISGENLFYIESHGIDPRRAEAILIKSEITKRLQIIDPSPESVKISSSIFGDLHLTNYQL